MKENHGLQLRSKSYNDHNKGPASVHSLLTQDSEICQKEKSQRTCLSTLVSIPCGWRGVVGWSLFLKLETFFFSAAIEIVNVALAETLRESWCLASPGLLL